MPSDLDELRVFQLWMGAFDVPAYMRRAKNTEAAWEHLLQRCERQRDEWLKFPKLRLGELFARAGDAAAIRPFLFDPTEADLLAKLHNAWQPRLRIPVPPARSPQQIRRSLQQVAASFARFNRRWERFVSELDLTEINRLRDGYNRFYVLEKECAVRSAAVARAGFQPVLRVKTEDVTALFPLLPSLRLS
jgi:hypothetical protein